MTYILLRQLLGGKYSKWIAILQEFDLEFTKSNSKKSLVFMELLCDLPSSSNNLTSKASIVDETLFLMSSSDPWYRDILVYLQTQTFRPNTSRSEQRCIRYQAKDYMIVSDTLYRHGVDTVLRRCLMHEEAEKVLNDCHSSACGWHLSGYGTAQKILRVGYFWPTIFKYCIVAAIVTDNGFHFRNHMMVELTAKLGLSHDSSTPYYPQANGQVEAINKVLKCMLQRMIGFHKRNLHLILYSALWAYRTSVRHATGCTPFQLVYGLEAILPIQCKISSLKLVIDLLPKTSEEEARFLELIHLDETHRDTALANEAHKKRVKVKFEKNVKPCVFSEGDLVLLYDQDFDKLGVGKFEQLWMGPYIVKWVLTKGAYELVDYYEIPLSQP
eukprot:PITA_04649